MRITFRVVVSFLFVMILTGIAGAPVCAFGQLPPVVTHTHEEPLSTAERDAQRRMAKEANKKRHEDIKRDTDKLLQLATELKLYVDKTNENMLSLEVVRKAEEVEKLSKEIQKKMRSGY